MGSIRCRIRVLRSAPSSIPRPQEKKWGSSDRVIVGTISEPAENAITDISEFLLNLLPADRKKTGLGQESYFSTAPPSVVSLTLLYNDGPSPKWIAPMLSR